MTVDGGVVSGGVVGGSVVVALVAVLHNEEQLVKIKINFMLILLIFLLKKQVHLTYT